MLPLDYGGDKCQACIREVISICKLVEHTPIFENYVESKSPTWLDIANLNMNKRSSWNSLETIWTSVRGVKVKCPWLDYGRIGHQELQSDHSVQMFASSMCSLPTFNYWCGQPMNNSYQ